MSPPTCFRCGKTPEEIPEYDEGGVWDKEDGYVSPSDFVCSEEGTYNPITKRFACTECYIAIGMPSSRLGWKAP